MRLLREEGLGASFTPFALFRDQFGYVPSLFRRQRSLPGLLEAEAGLAAAILFRNGALSR